MRQKSKVLVSFLLALSVLLSFTVAVSADSAQKTDSGHCGNYDWAYYTNHELKITASLTDIDLSTGITAKVISKVTTITIDISNAEIKKGTYSDSDNNYLTIKTSTAYTGLAQIRLLNSDNLDQINVLSLNNIPGNIQSVIAPAGKVFDKIYLNTRTENLNFLSSLTYDGIMITSGMNLKSVSICDSATWMEIYGTDSFLETINLPDSLERLSLYHLPKLCSINLNDGLQYCYFEDVNLEEISIPKDCRATFEEVPLKTVVYEPGSKIINGYAFQCCNTLESVTIPDGVTRIEYYAFVGCHNLKTVQLPDSVEEICGGAFQATGLTSITIPSKVTKLGANVFRNCEDLESVTIPKSVKTIVNSAFAECDNLSEVYYSGSPEEWNYITVKTDFGITTTSLKDCFNGVTPTFAKSNKYIKTNPVDYSGNTGEKATFSVSTKVSGVSYQWQYNNGSGWKNSNSTGYNTSTMSVKVTDARDGQLYRCIIIDKSGTKTVKVASDAAAIHTAFDGKITKQPSDFSGLIGKKATFTVETEGSNLTYQWQYNNGSGWKNSNSTGYDTASMTVKITEARNGQLYRCIIKNSNGKQIISDEAKIIVTRPEVKITKQPVDVYDEMGKYAVFSVEAEGEGLTYKWQYSTGYGWKDSTATGCNTPELKIKITEARDNQMYHCIVTDKYGQKDYSTPVFIRVVSKSIEITSQPTDYSGAIGTTAKFTVGVSGEDVTYQWQYYNDNKEWTNSTKSGYDTPTLSVKITEARRGQAYRCVIKDKNGNPVISNTGYIIITYSVTGPDITSQPSDFTGAVGSKATFSVEVSGDGLTYQWQYSKDGQTWNNSTASGCDTASLSIKVTGARNGQQYRCIVTDSTGITATSYPATLSVG